MPNARTYIAVCQLITRAIKNPTTALRYVFRRLFARCHELIRILGGDYPVIVKKKMAISTCIFWGRLRATLN